MTSTGMRVYCGQKSPVGIQSTAQAIGMLVGNSDLAPISYVNEDFDGDFLRIKPQVGCYDLRLKIGGTLHQSFVTDAAKARDLATELSTYSMAKSTGRVPHLLI